MPYLSLTINLLLLSLLSGCDLPMVQSNVKVKEEPAQGITEQALDQNFLQNLSEETRLAAEQRLQQTYERNKVPPNERTSHAQTSGHYERLGEHQLAVINLSYSANPMRVMRIVGIEEDRLITISCIAPLGEALDLRDEASECGRTVKQYFTALAE